MPTDREIEAATEAMDDLGESYWIELNILAKAALEAAEKVRSKEVVVGYITDIIGDALTQKPVTAREFYLPPLPKKGKNNAS